MELIIDNEEELVNEIHPLDMAEIVMGDESLTITKLPDPKTPGAGELTVITKVYRQTCAVARKKGQHVIS